MNRSSQNESKGGDYIHGTYLHLIPPQGLSPRLYFHNNPVKWVRHKDDLSKSLSWDLCLSRALEPRPLLPICNILSTTYHWLPLSTAPSAILRSIISIIYSRVGNYLGMCLVNSSLTPTRNAWALTHSFAFCIMTEELILSQAVWLFMSRWILFVGLLSHIHIGQHGAISISLCTFILTQPNGNPGFSHS